MKTLNVDLVSYQLGVLKGCGFSDTDIAHFAELMRTEHTVRPTPRHGCAADLHDNPTSTTVNGSQQ